MVLKHQLFYIFGYLFELSIEICDFFFQLCSKYGYWKPEMALDFWHIYIGCIARKRGVPQWTSIMPLTADFCYCVFFCRLCFFFEFFSGPWKSSEKLWLEFFWDPSQWWGHGSEKVSGHQTSQSSHVDAAIALDVGVNLVALSWVPSCPDLNKWHESCFVPWQSWDNIRSLEKVGQCNMLMEKVRAAFSLLMVPFNPGMCRIPDCSA
jgi:hypothetical protein